MRRTTARTCGAQHVKVQGHYAILSATLLLQLHFNSSRDTHVVPDEVILCIMEKIVLSPIWRDFIAGTIKMSIREGVECRCSNKVALKIALWQSV